MWFNPIIELILKSSLHGMLSGNTMIIYFTGCKSGKPYHVPVGYLRSDNHLLTVSYKARTWWRNLCGGADVKILLKGQLLPAHAQTVEDDPGVEQGLRAFIKQNPRFASGFKVSVSADGQLDPLSLQQAVKTHVIVHTILE
jgi:deazaflavin-dependent oxidoreductase (nitroreductase family)